MGPQNIGVWRYGVWKIGCKKNIDGKPRYKLSNENEKVFTKRLNETELWDLEEIIKEMWKKVAECFKCVAWKSLIEVEI